jgi:hypothetical protein
MFKYRITDRFYNRMMQEQSSVTSPGEDTLKELPVA